VAESTVSKGSFGSVQVLEGAGGDPYVGEGVEVAPGDRRETRTQLDTYYLAAPFRQCQRGLSRADPYLQHTARRTDAGQLRQVVEESGGIAGPHAVVTFGVSPEGESESLPFRALFLCRTALELVCHDRATGLS